jgi:hemerythrin-like domain-containing protein
MLVKIGQSADHGFDEPLGLLSDCHRRIEQFLGALITITEARKGQELAPADRRALEGALQYFRTAAPRHSADEEDSLFPRLRACEAAEARAAMQAVDRLEADHRVADEHHQAVDTLGRRWLEAGSLVADDVAALTGHLKALERLYRAHIRAEDGELFPAAGKVLTASDLEAIGREMAARRNVPYHPPRGLAE